MNTFKKGDTVERINGPRLYISDSTIAVVEKVKGCSIILKGFGTGGFDASFFKLVPERDVTRKALSDAVALLRNVGVSYYSQDHSVGVKRAGIVDEMPIAQMLDELCPDNKEAEDKIQAIIDSLQDNLVTAQQQLTDLRGE